MRSSFVFLRALKPYKVKCFKGCRTITNWGWNSKIGVSVFSAQGGPTPSAKKSPTPLHLKNDTPYMYSAPSAGRISPQNKKSSSSHSFKNSQYQPFVGTL